MKIYFNGRILAILQTGAFQKTVNLTSALHSFSGKNSSCFKCYFPCKLPLKPLMAVGYPSSLSLHTFYLSPSPSLQKQKHRTPRIIGGSLLRRTAPHWEIDLTIITTNRLIGVWVQIYWLEGALASWSGLTRMRERNARCFTIEVRLAGSITAYAKKQRSCMRKYVSSFSVVIMWSN